MPKNTERKRVEKIVQLSFESSHDALMVLSTLTGQFVLANKATLQLFGVASEVEFYKLGAGDISPKQQPDGSDSNMKAQEMIAIALRDGSHQFEWEHQRLNGQTFPADVLLTRMAVDESVFLQATVRDITDVKKNEAQVVAQYVHVAQINEQLAEMNRQLKLAQNQLLQSQKMAAIGLLAAGVAHEINNPIGYVHSNLGTLEGYVADLFAVVDKYEAIEQGLTADTTELIDLREFKQKIDLSYVRKDVMSLFSETHEGLERVKKIVLDLKDFSRASEEESWVWSDVSQGLASTLNVVWNELKYKCEVVKEYRPLPQIYCLPSQLNQVFMNLLVNAAQAIEERGTITIRTGEENGGVWISVSDTGSGISAENIPFLFDPFFTTKPVGKGTGLGLSVSYSIVEKHHGKIEVQSEVGKGTTFKVWLPVQWSNQLHA
ncbi:MAG: ATP-binding protein [Gallionellaceae bacterium]